MPGPEFHIPNFDPPEYRDVRQPTDPPEVIEADDDRKGWDITSCPCEIPDFEVSKGSAGPYEMQIVHCEGCNHMFGFVVDHEGGEA